MRVVDLQKFDSLIYSYSYEEHPDQSQFFVHDHDDMEIYFLIDGHVRFHVNNTVYYPQSGDIVITRPGELHYVEIDENETYKRYNIRFSSELLKESLNRRLLLPFLNRPSGSHNLYTSSELPADFIQNCLNRMFLHLGNENKARATSYLIPILQELYDSWCTKDIPHETPRQSLLEEIITYINQHLTDFKSIQEITDMFHLSQAQLYRIFREYTGTTIWNYVRTKRLITAQILVQNGELPAEAAIQCGFDDYSTFYRAYKRHFGHSPSADSSQKRGSTKRT